MTSTRLEEAINEHVKQSLENHKPTLGDPKIIHDPILGSNVFSREEVAVIDLPLVQRLRHISQTDVAPLVYPACHHTRFEHSLGVAVIAARLVDAVNKASDGAELISQNHKLEVRLAALLHDIGHGPFSHLSETRYQDSEIFLETKRAKGDLFENAKPHEALSYLMVTCEAFRSYFDSEIISASSVGSVDLERIGCMIIGKMKNPDVEGYLGDIINGVFDADKLDYIQRDAYFSGLKMAVDLDRILHSVWVPQKKDQLARRLTVRTGAVSALEQILFHKVQLYSTIYHHQKVRSAECLTSAIFDILSTDNHTTVNGKAVKDPVDFLKVVDADILFGYTDNESLRNYTARLRNRDLLRRALVVCTDTIENPKNSGFFELLKQGSNPEGLLALRKLIAKQCPGLISNVKDIWVDIPSTPSLREPSQFYVCDPKGTPRKLGEFFHTQDWLATYSENKTRIHVFCYADGKARRKIGECAASVFEELFDMKLKPNAFDWAKNF